MRKERSFSKGDVFQSMQRFGEADGLAGSNIPFQKFDPDQECNVEHPGSNRIFELGNRPFDLTHIQHACASPRFSAPYSVTRSSGALHTAWSHGPLRCCTNKSLNSLIFRTKKWQLNFSLGLASHVLTIQSILSSKYRVDLVFKKTSLSGNDGRIHSELLHMHLSTSAANPPSMEFLVQHTKRT